MLSTAPLVAQAFFSHTVIPMGEADGRRGKVTPENKEESKRLKALWEKHRPSGLTQVEFGEQFNVGSQSAVTNMLNGHMAISQKAAKAFARGLGVEVKQFSPRLAGILEEASIPAAWPLGEEITPAVWETLPEKIRIKIQNDAEFIVREHRRKSGKSYRSQGGASRRRAA
jgi:transcriptional regulator with XRE-family HTH domain